MTELAHTYRLEIVTVVAIAAFCFVFLYASSCSGGTTFAGTDSIAATKISGAGGTLPEDIHPLIPQWIPPSAEIESTLFGIQAAIGGLFIGGVFGYWIGQERKTE